MAIYTPPYFSSSDPQVIESLIQENNFGTLVTITSKQELRFSHLPFLFDRSKASHGILYAHMARANPQWKDFITSPSVTAVFQGPHAYISPRWYEPEADNVPTWNYTAVHVHGIPRVLTNPEDAFLVMQELVQHHDPNWDFNLSAQDRDTMMNEIVVFEIVATKIDAKLKMNQNRSKTDQENVSLMLLRSSNNNERKMGALMK